MPKEIDRETEVFADNGNVSGTGFAKNPLFIYNKHKSSASYFRTKETDAYYIKGDDAALYIAIENAGFIGTVSAVLWDNKNHKQYSRTIKRFLPYLHFSMPSSVSYGDTSYTDSRVGMKFSKSGDMRHIRADFINFQDSMHLYVNLSLRESAGESFNISMPFKDSKTSFFLKTFIPGMSAEGIIRCGGSEFSLSGENSAGSLLWTRSSSAEKARIDSLYCYGKVRDNDIVIMLSNNANVPNCIFANGRVRTVPPVKKVYDEDMKCCKYVGKNGSLELSFFVQTMGGTLFEADCATKTVRTGSVFGSITLDGKKILIDDFHGFSENLIL